MLVPVPVPVPVRPSALLPPSVPVPAPVLVPAPVTVPVRPSAPLPLSAPVPVPEPVLVRQSVAPTPPVPVPVPVPMPVPMLVPAPAQVTVPVPALAIGMPESIPIRAPKRAGHGRPDPQRAGQHQLPAMNTFMPIESAVGPGMFLNVQGGSEKGWANVFIWEGYGNPETKWRLQEAPNELSGARVFCIESYVKPNMFLNVAERGGKNGARVDIWDGCGNTESKWRLHHEEGSEYCIESLVRPGMFLNVNGGGTNNGANVVIFEGCGNPETKWKLHDGARKEL